MSRRFLNAQKVSGRDVEAYQQALTPPVDVVMTAFNREQTWRSRGEFAIRGEMEQAVARRLVRRRIDG